MNKIEFSKLEKKEDMQLAFNQLKDDYHILFERHEKLKGVIEEVRRYIDVHKKWVKNDDEMVEPILDGYNIRDILQILDKSKEGNNE